MDTVLEPIPVRDALESRESENTPGFRAPDAMPDRNPTMGEKPAEVTPAAGRAEASGGATRQRNRHRRVRLLLLFGGFLLFAAAAWWLWANVFAGDVESTENAYTNVELAQVTPLVGAPVKRVLVVESQRVAAGDVLVELDDADLRLAVSQAEAALGKARRRVWQLEANDASLEGQEKVRAAEEETARADLARAQADLDKALLDEDRAQKLSSHGWAPTQRLDDAHTSVRQARAAVAQAEARIAVSKAAQHAAAGARRANQALLENATVETNPEVAAARAQLDQARLDLERAIIRAPVDGIVDQRRIAVGQRVQAGAPIMVVVPLQDMHVEANFKEVQLARVRPGQPVRLTSDLYGPDIVYRGRVGGFAGGTGAAFAAIPAQNATGNWIKVVQRLPVRIELDPAELRAHPLRVGLSMHATIDLSGPR